MEARARVLEADPAPQHVDVDELPALSVPTREEIERAFAPGGLVAAMYPEYEPRPEQVAMALEVRDALATSSHRVIEAGTGVGKSVGYLVPLALTAKRNNITVGVATKSNNLADQLMFHELPRLARELDDGLSYTALKGYDHYPWSACAAAPLPSRPTATRRTRLPPSRSSTPTRASRPRATSTHSASAGGASTARASPPVRASARAGSARSFRTSAWSTAPVVVRHGRTWW